MIKFSIHFIVSRISYSERGRELQREMDASVE